MNEKAASVLRRKGAARGGQRGFTLTEMLIATVVVLAGLVAVAQLVPTSVMPNATNRNDGTALALAERQMEALRALPLALTTFNDPLGIICPIGTTCSIGDPTQPGVVVGSPVVLINNSPVIDFSQSQVAGYGFTFTDPNDPLGAVNDVRWAVITMTNGAVTGKRIIVGVFRRGMKTLAYPISLDTLVLK